MVNDKFLSLHEDVYSASDRLAPMLRVDDEALIQRHMFLAFVHRSNREFPGAIPRRNQEQSKQRNDVNNSLAPHQETSIKDDHDI